MVKSRNIFIEGLQGSGKSTLLAKLSKQFKVYQVYREGDISPVELAWCSYMTQQEYEKALAKFPDLKQEMQSHTLREDSSSAAEGSSSVTEYSTEKKTHESAEVQKDSVFITAYTLILAENRKFYEYMEQYEIYNGRIPFERFRHVIYERYRRFRGTGNIFECSFFQNAMEDMMLFYQLSDEEILSFYRGAYEQLEQEHFHMIYLVSGDIEQNILNIKKERSDEAGNEMWYPLMMNYFMTSPYGKEHDCKEFSDLIAHFKRREKLEMRIIEEVIKENCICLPAKEYDLEKLCKKLER